MKSDQTKKYQTDSVHRKKKNAEGFTLIEVLIAMVILMVGLLAIATMQISAIRVNATALSITQRATLAQDKLEELVALPYTDSLLNTTTGGPPHEDTTDVPDGYTLTWTVEDSVSNPGQITVAGIKEINVSARESGSTFSIFYIKPQFD